MDAYRNFSEIVRTWKEMDGPALLYAENDAVASLSYRELYDAVQKEAEVISASDAEPVDLLYDDHTPACVIRIFANTIAGRDTLFGDMALPEEVLSDIRQQILLRRQTMQEPADREGELFFFTSGTTSRSRVVILTGRSLAKSAWCGQSMLSCRPGDILLSILPFSHVFGFVCSMLWGLAYGAAVALGRGPRHIIDDTLFYDPTILPAVPTMAEAIARFGTINPNLRTLLIGAAPVSDAFVSSMQSRGIDVYLGYGLTETSSGIAITQDLSEPAALSPCPEADIQIGEDGEISVATPCMMEGYLGEPDPFTDGRFYTGDLGSFDAQGRLHLTGRKKDVLILADGTKIYCPEYEEALRPDARDADLAVVLRNGRPVLAVAPLPNSEAATDPVSMAGRMTLLQSAVDLFNRTRPRSQQIADIIYFNEPFPRTAIGKLKRWQLQQEI